MKHKNELDRLIRNLYLIKNTNLNNILETYKLAITRTTNFIEALINKIDPKNAGTVCFSATSSLQSSK
ncbi:MULTISPECIES: hypothetical protein [spotted fever group]|uniref:Uncharacterized protein n=2 Tax=spotted fever group TaxID=114277 RepID=A0A0F3PFK2_RICRH|nr:MULTISPECIES: hypothetical protein [spotted fever group]AFB31849.1 hypothetical protein RMB_05440 [Rickettsia massiliae str. AZT80]KJV78722.1 hypothetical protein RMAECT_1166 [Rickettsia rhipicephali str. Ect]